jgi:hypothetical protein
LLIGSLQAPLEAEGPARAKKITPRGTFVRRRDGRRDSGAAARVSFY